MLSAEWCREMMPERIWEFSIGWNATMLGNVGRQLIEVSDKTKRFDLDIPRSAAALPTSDHRFVIPRVW